MKLEEYLEEHGELAHFGVKGMRWGVRKSDSGSSKPRGKIRRAATKANAALDAGAKVIDEGEKKLIFLPQEHRQRAASRTQSRVLGEAAAINRSPQFKGKDLKGNTRLRNAYMKKVEEAAKTVYAEELNISRTEAWGEVLSVNTNNLTTSMRFAAARDRIKHVDEDDLETLLVLDLETDELGQIIGVKAQDKYLGHSDEDEDLELVHYGVKGMKWGVRKAEKLRDTASRNRRISEGTATTRDKIDQAVLGKGMKGFGGLLSLNPKVAGKLADQYEKKAGKVEAKLDKKYEKSFEGMQGWVKINNSIAGNINPKLDVLNAKPEYNVDMTAPGKSAVHKRYISEYRSALQKSLDESMSEFGTNYTGTKKVELKVTGEGMESSWEARLVDIKHSDEDQTYVVITPKWDSKGRITDQEFEIVVPKAMAAMAHGEEFDDFLAHYGVKGMKWGVRKSGDSDEADSGPVSEDHTRAVAALTKASTSGLASLSTKEMRELTNRLEAERKFNQLSAERAKAQRSVGKKFVDFFVGEAGDFLVKEGSNLAKDRARQTLRSMGEKEKAAPKPKKVKNLDEVLKPYSNRR